MLKKRGRNVVYLVVLVSAGLMGGIDSPRAETSPTPGKDTRQEP